MASAWSPASAGVVTICAPNAPSLLEPASGIVFDYGGGNITFGWAHNPKDGSAQTAAEVAYSVDGGATWTTQTVATAKTCTIANDFALNDVVTWKVRTKGSHADFSPYSNTRIFAVYQQPTVLFEEPADGFTVENVPIHCKVGYSDASGGMANLTVYAVEGDYDPSKPKLFEMNMGTVQEFDVPASMFTPENGKTYTLVAVTRSSSTMQGIATRSIAVDFVEPMHGALDVENDAEAGTTSILAKLVMDEAKEIAVSMNVYRVHDGKRVLLGENIGNGASLVDLYAPLNVDYAYEVVTFAASGPSPWSRAPRGSILSACSSCGEARPSAWSTTPQATSRSSARTRCA